MPIQNYAIKRSSVLPRKILVRAYTMIYSRLEKSRVGRVTMEDVDG